MRKSLAIAAPLVVLASIAVADECAWVTKDVAQKAAAAMKDKTAFQSYCPTCGDKRASRIPYKKVTAAQIKDHAEYWGVFADDDNIDLSYVYIQDGDRWLNVGLIAGCPDDDQAKVLPFNFVDK